MYIYMFLNRYSVQITSVPRINSEKMDGWIIGENLRLSVSGMESEFNITVGYVVLLMILENNILTLKSW